MIRRFWRRIHLWFGALIVLYLLLASITGAILGINNILANKPAYPQNTAELVGQLQKQYPELTMLQREDTGVLSLQAFDEDYNEIKGIIVPAKTGFTLQKAAPKNAFIENVRILHRSLFLDNAGRIIAGLLSIFFFLQLFSGVVLLLKSVPDLRQIFTQWRYQNWALTYHYSVGKVFLIPLLVTALSAGILFLYRYEVISTKSQPATITYQPKDGKKTPTADFAFLKNLPTSDLQSIQFPFDESEPMVVETAEAKYSVRSTDGAILTSQKLSAASRTKDVVYNLHTGEGSRCWSVVLVLSALTVPGFAFSGLSLFLRRRKKQSTGAEASESTTVILYSSEGGSTAIHAAAYADQLRHMGHSVYLATLGDAKTFPNMERLVLLVATTGDGESPADSLDFDASHIQSATDKVRVSLLGFGSRHYPKFCAFAKQVQAQLQKAHPQWEWPVVSHVHERDAEEIAEWETQVNNSFGWNLNYQNFAKNEGADRYQKFTVHSITPVSDLNRYFKVVLNCPEGTRSGDLLKVQIPDTEEYRFYSLAVVDQQAELMVKHFPQGKCSSYLASLRSGDQINAEVQPNAAFHYGAHPAILVCNGTGIAPYRGFVAKNTHKLPLTLYAGFREADSLTAETREEMTGAAADGRLKNLFWTYTRGQESVRITQKVRENITEIVHDLLRGTHLYICGSVSLKQDIDLLLDEELERQGSNIRTKELYHINQIHTDCYR